MGLLPRRDLGLPLDDRAAELVDLGWARVVLEIDPEAVDELGCEYGVGVGVDRPHDFFCVPGHADLAVRVAGLEEAQQLRASLVVDAFISLGEQPAAPIQRVGLVASVTEGVVLHPSPALIQLLVRELHHMERVRDLNRVRQHRVEHQPVRAPQVEGCELDPITPLLRSLLEPLARPRSVATLDHVEQLASAGADDLGRPRLGAPRSDPREQHLVEPDRGDVADPGRVINECCPVRDDRVVDRVPITPEFHSDLVHRPCPPADLASHPPADLASHPPARPIRHPQPGRRDRRRILGPGPNRTRAVRARPPALVPHQPRRPPEAAQVDELNDRSVLNPHRPGASRTHRSITHGLDMDPQRFDTVAVIDPKDSHSRQADQQRAHARRVQFHEGSRFCRR